MRSKLIVYPDGTDQPGVTFDCDNGFVSRVVSAVAEQNIPDAERVCAILNARDMLLAELAASLREMVKCYGRDDGGGPILIIERARAALAKAGAQP